MVSGFDLSVASLALSIAESATVISLHKLHFPSISGRMVVIPCEERGVSGRMVGIPCEARGISGRMVGITYKARGITAPGALPYGPL